MEEEDTQDALMAMVGALQMVMGTQVPIFLKDTFSSQGSLGASALDVESHTGRRTV